MMGTDFPETRQNAMDLIILFDGDDYGGGGGGGESEKGISPPRTAMEEEKLYVAVGKEVRESESTLLWAIQNSGGRLISILHVHHPDDFIPILGKKYHSSSLEEQQVRVYRRIERQLMLKTLDEYLHICRQFGVEAEKLYIEMDSIENGILQLIARHKIEKLVMGAAADDDYHKKMMAHKSKKAVHIQLHAPASCHIWFICKGHLIHEREGSSQAIMYTENERSTNSISLSIPGLCSKSEDIGQELLLEEGSLRNGWSNGKVTEFPTMHNTGFSSVSRTQLGIESNSEDGSEILRLSRSRRPDVYVGSSSHVSRESTADLDPCSPPAFARAKSSESLYLEEMRKRKELEEELQKVKNDRDRLREELQVAIDQNSVLESKVETYDQVMRDLEEGMISNVEMLQICEKERDDMKIERDSVLKTAEELLNQSSSVSDVPKFFNTLNFAEIKEATNDFDPSLQLWEGENGSIYKGVLSHKQVTIKMWCPEGLQGPNEFHQEVEILSKFRHPNIGTLIGVCPETLALIYEHFSNGSLEDRLRCKDNSPPLSWQTRITIAMELCSTLIYLHSRRLVHCALKPASILLDSNFTCKLIDFGFSCIIPNNENSLSSEVSYTGSYTDPEFFVTGEVSPAVDVYSFGMILMELLTGKQAFEVKDELESALDENNFYSLLDTSAGEWPFVQARQLAQQALMCCEENASNRPDLESDIWRVLGPMSASCGGCPSYHLGDEEHRQAPSYFICPIFQEVMKDPHVAADGYTYEVEALRGWLDAGHDTSPMTNLQLEHLNLVPNHALRSAIHEWRDKH